MANATQGTAGGPEIHMPRGRLQGAAMLFLGLWALMFGGTAVLIAIKPSSAGVGFGVIGGIVSVFGIGAIATGGRSLFTGAPRFRATSDGVWFGGGSLVPWTAVNQVFEGAVSARS